MTAKFHVNDNGEIGRCSAKNGNCPFGADSHSDTVYGARQIFEQRQKQNITPPLTKESLAEMMNSEPNDETLKQEFLELDRELKELNKQMMNDPTGLFSGPAIKDLENRHLKAEATYRKLPVNVIKEERLNEKINSNVSEMKNIISKNIHDSNDYRRLAVLSGMNESNEIDKMNLDNEKSLEKVLYWRANKLIYQSQLLDNQGKNIRDNVLKNSKNRFNLKNYKQRSEQLNGAEKMTRQSKVISENANAVIEELGGKEKFNEISQKFN